MSCNFSTHFFSRDHTNWAFYKNKQTNKKYTQLHAILLKLFAPHYDIYRNRGPTFLRFYFSFLDRKFICVNFFYRFFDFLFIFIQKFLIYSVNRICKITNNKKKTNKQNFIKNKNRRLLWMFSSNFIDVLKIIYLVTNTTTKKKTIQKYDDNLTNHLNILIK